VLINWHLIFAPKKVLAMLSRMNWRICGIVRTGEFWGFMATIMPDYEASKAWLERGGLALGDGFLKGCGIGVLQLGGFRGDRQTL
jgi:hypothetical protein